MRKLLFIPICMFITIAGNFLFAQENLVDKNISGISAKADEKFKNKEFTLAANLYLENLKILDLKGYKDVGSLYNAAIAFKNAENFTKSNEMFMQILNEKYSEVSLIYYLQDKKGDPILSTKSEYETSGQEVKNKKNTNKPLGIAEYKIINDDVYENLIYNYFKSGNAEKALEVAKKGIELYPNNNLFPKFKEALTDAIQKREDMKLSLEELVKKYPENGQYAYLLSLKEENKANKESLLENAVKNDVKNPGAYIQLVKSYLEEDMDIVEAINAHINNPYKSKDETVLNSLNQKRKELFESKIYPTLEKGLAQSPENEKLLKIKKRVDEYLNSTGIKLK